MSVVIALSVPALVIFPLCLVLLYRLRETEFMESSRNIENSLASGALMLTILVFLSLDNIFQSRPHIFDLLACFALLPTLLLNLALKGYALNIRYRVQMAKAYLAAPASESVLILGTKYDEWYLQNERLRDMKHLNKYTAAALTIHTTWVSFVWAYSEYPLENALGTTRIVTMAYMFMLSVHIGWRLVKLLDVHDAYWLKKEIKWTCAALSPTALALAFAASEPSFDFVTLILALGVWMAFMCAVMVPLNKARRLRPDTLSKQAFPLESMLEDELNVQRFKAYLVREFNVETLMAWREAEEYRRQLLQSPHLKNERMVGYTFGKNIERLYQLFIKKGATCEIRGLSASLQEDYAQDFGPMGELLRGKAQGDDITASGHRLDEAYLVPLQAEALNLLRPAYVRYCVKNNVVFMMPLHSA